MYLEGKRNRLARESSPYLRQHAGNPVDWFPWGEEALEKARREDRPIFLSIGYAACHWCHVMERESFESTEVAAFLNRHFVSIKVDREERPDVDAVYMEAVQAMTGSGGWPLTVFLTPTLKPFFGGTYFPPQRRWGRPSFLELLVAVVEAWSTRRADIENQAGTLLDHLASAGHRDHSGPLDAQATLLAAVAALARRFDPVHGGFDGAPKFPGPARLSLLCHAAARGDATAARMLSATLDGMARGGMYDWVGGGFHRYSVDAQWLVPHFEKMLYDNALLARLYGEAGLALARPAWLEVARETAEYLVREMQGAEGGFFSSTDADSEGEEGRYFTWTPGDIAATLGEEEAAAIIAACGVTPHGNFEHGRTILRPTSDLLAVARSLNVPREGLGELLQRARVNLRVARARRVPPALDDKRLAGWNGMAVWALAYLGVTLEEPRFLGAAARAGEFLLARCVRPGQPVVRAWKDGVSSGAETLEDVAWVAAGLAELYQAGGDTRYLAAARQVLRERVPHYRGPNGVLFETPDDGEPRRHP
ncbi:MAG: thioredoxin domain-containing protein, partial [Acidobacteriota bacterium]